MCMLKGVGVCTTFWCELSRLLKLLFRGGGVGWGGGGVVWSKLILTAKLSVGSD